MTLMHFCGFALAAVLSITSCQKKEADNRYSDFWDKGEQKDTTVVESAWKDVSKDFGTLPEYIKVYSATELEGAKAVAFIADVDLSKQGFEVWGLNAPTLEGTTDNLQTPMQVYNAKGKPSVVINAGFFYTSGGKRYSSSLEVSNGTLLSPNINYASEDWKTIYSPTRGAFIQHSDGTYEVAWTFWKNASNHWIYDTPAENSYKAKPLATPSATFPCAGRKFEAKNAIGGGPVLLKNSEVRNTATAELFDGSNGIMVDGKHPRTAIGITAAKHLVLFVCEGRNMTEGVSGFTTLEVANILKEYGCTDAMNLDGGGSTLMLVNGKEVLKPSDGKERSVGSCVYVK